MTAPQCEQPAARAGAPPVPMTLRAIAAWLESRPTAQAHFIDFPLAGRVVVLGLLVTGDPSLEDRTRELGDGWTEGHRGGREWQIAPGVVYRLRDAR